MNKQLMALLTEEDGTSFVEFTLFVGFLFLAGAGFLFFAGSQFKEAFMSSKATSF
jgi:Flp pilus assembly pilin Flp